MGERVLHCSEPKFTFLSLPKKCVSASTKAGGLILLLLVLYSGKFGDHLFLSFAAIFA